MKKTTKTLTIILLVLLVLVFLYFAGTFSFLNAVVPQSIDYSCHSDSECKFFVFPEWASCSACAPCQAFDVTDKEVIAVNKEWVPFCPFYEAPVACGLCIGGINNADENQLKCIAGKCEKMLG